MATPKIEDEIKRLEGEAKLLTQRAEQLQRQQVALTNQMRQTREQLLIVEGQFRAFKSLMPELEKPKKEMKKRTPAGKGRKKIG